MREINKILVANRGEIALRVMRTAKKMGIKTVAVYSAVDRHMPHVLFADEAVCLGAAPSSESYLRIDKIIAACKELNVDAIHPGYGFLSENAHFAQIVSDAGIIFIGPSPYSITTMGSKLGAKAAVKDFGIPMVPGSDGAISNITEAKKIAIQTGYPILIKASAGGGGKGMRVVENESEFDEQMQRAASEAQSAFGDAAVFIEKFVTAPRHIEVQVLADNHGNVVHLFERECSIQRRHQKLVEEAPSSILTEVVREKMCADAVKVARACNYSGAGTVEFLIDDKQNYYFLEMNTRLQVEHPVTEYITGLDLVEQQIRVARNEKLAFNQSDLKIKGHAIELRICAENPLNNFLPGTGVLDRFRPPFQLKNTRIDSGFEEGNDISVYYDSLIAKLICYGATRAEAIVNLKTAIQNFDIEGVPNTLNFGKFVMENPHFIAGDFDTHFISKYFKPELLNHKDEELVAAQLALQIYLSQKKKFIEPQITVTKWRDRF